MVFRMFLNTTTRMSVLAGFLLVGLQAALASSPIVAQQMSDLPNACAPSYQDWLLPSEENYSALGRTTGKPTIHDRLH